MPEPDGSDNCSEMIAKMYFKGQENKTIKLSGYKEILDRRADLDKLIKKWKRKRKKSIRKLKWKCRMQPLRWKLVIRYRGLILNRTN